MLRVESLRKVYTRGFPVRVPTFQLEADFRVERPEIIGVLGPNGSGKTTLFELITGSNRPTSGRITCAGQDIHRVKYAERSRLAMHYHQSYQVRSFVRREPSFLLQKARREQPLVHLFDEPQFSIQDGYIGFMLEFFRRLHREEKVVFVCLHPNEPYHLELLAELCGRFIFVSRGQLTHADSLRTLAAHAPFREYLGSLADNAACLATTSSSATPP